MHLEWKGSDNDQSRWRSAKLTLFGYQISLKIHYYDSKYLAERYGSEVGLSGSITRQRR